MHIPDGYLSPSTCLLTYALVLPFWWQAFARVKRTLHTAAAPLLALFSALSFVIMMFNLPLPGGTTGHAVGMAIVTIVAGPSAGIVAISMALLIQALFFGDGGITTLGANAFNMAVVGCGVAHLVYTLLAGRSAVGSRWRVVAAGLAGYLAINASALLTAIEFGIQPLLFHDASGTPLYAPYPPGVAIPAMMLGHLTFAGLAELLVTATLFAYLQRARPELLAERSACGGQGRRRLYPLVGVLSLLLLLSPLGLLAPGCAWGEWELSAFSSATGRQQIEHFSGHVPLPGQAPAGLVRAAGLWSPPMPDYAPPRVHSAAWGYLLAALVGCGVILLTFLLLCRFGNRHTSGALRP